MDALGHVAGLLVLAFVCFIGLASLVFSIPGTFIILGAAFVYGWLTGFETIDGITLGWLTGLSLLGEVLEFLSSAFGGGERPTRRTAIAAVFGGLVGGLLGAPILFGLGALFGALAGAFAGAAIASLTQQGDASRALRTGLSAMKGRFLGFVTKLAIAVTMIVVLFASAL